MIAKMPQASFAPPEMSSRVSRSIQISTTAIGCRKHSSSSTTFFMPGAYPPAARPSGPPGAARLTAAAPGDRHAVRMGGAEDLLLPVTGEDGQADLEAAVAPGLKEEIGK